MYCDFYSFHDKVDFFVENTGSKMSKFRYRFIITYKGLSYSSYCKSYDHIASDTLCVPFSCYMMRKRAPNRSMSYFLAVSGATWRFVLNEEFNKLFETWLAQFPICIDLD